ncbi:unnamed protein product [Amoebophrya sp. A25]|nr:unnamed protein product [Amoebophrya sp. A25]|eukprot:GSA25T00009195001.1
MVFQQLLSCHNGNGMDWLSSLKGEPWISGQKHAIDDFFQIKTRTSNKFLAASFLEGPPTLGTASAPPRPHQGPTTSGQDGSTTSTGNIVPERPSHTPNMQLPHPAPGHEAKEYRSLADDPQTFPFDLSNLQKIPDDVQKMYLVRKRDMLRKHQMAMNMNYQNPDDVPDGQAFATKLPADPDPICQQLHNCPDRFGDFGNGGAAGAGGGLGTGKDGLMGDGTGPSSDSELLLDDGGAGAANDGRYDPIPEDDALDAAERSLMPCDGYGRIETAGKFPSMGEYCTDPHKRGYNICVSILPTDFAKRTGGFCYSSVLNAASNSQWFYEKNHRWHRQPMMIAAREDPSVGHRKVKTNLADVYEIKDTKGMYWPRQAHVRIVAV